MEQILHPEEIAKIFMRYYKAETFHIRFPEKKHADFSIIKSWMGCSGYHRENFDFNKYKLNLRPLHSIMVEEMYALSKILIRGLTKSINSSFTQSNYNTRYNCFGLTYTVLSHIDGSIKVLTDLKPHDGEVNYGLGYQYLYERNFDMPMYFGEDHWANGKTPYDLGYAILFA